MTIEIPNTPSQETDKVVPFKTKKEKAQSDLESLMTRNKENAMESALLRLSSFDGVIILLQKEGGPPEVIMGGGLHPFTTIGLLEMVKSEFLNTGLDAFENVDVTDSEEDD